MNTRIIRFQFDGFRRVVFQTAGSNNCLAKPVTIWQLRDAISEAHSTGQVARQRV
jgi:hypothetical protein